MTILCEALRSGPRALNTLIVDGLPFPPNIRSGFAQGVERCSSLGTVSMNYCVTATSAFVRSVHELTRMRHSAKISSNSKHHGRDPSNSATM